MDTSEFVFWLCTSINIASTLTLAAHLRKRVSTHALTERKAKGIYSWLAVAAGILTGIVLFLAIIVFFNIPLGNHGVILVAGPLFSLLISFSLVFIGRLIIGWEPIKW